MIERNLKQVKSSYPFKNLSNLWFWYA